MTMSSAPNSVQCREAAVDVREVLLRSYRIVYRIHGTEIRVLTVFESHRLLPQEILDEIA